jgi:hypothetical protein
VNEKLAALITDVKTKRKAFDKARKKFEAWQLEDVEGRELADAESALARWIVKNADKLRSVE